MNKDKLFTSMKKSFSKMPIIFSIGIVWYALAAVLGGYYISPGNVLKFFALIILITIFAGFRIYIDGGKWTMGLPFFVKNLIIAPFCLVSTIICILSMEGIESNILTVIFVVVIFTVTFIISSIVRYYIEKAKADEMNDALLIFKEEHFGGEQEW